MAHHFPLYGTFIDDLNKTVRELEVLRDAVRKTTSVILQLQSSATAQSITGYDASANYAECYSCGKEGGFCVNGDTVWCFLLAALVGGVCIGLWLAGDQSGRRERERMEAGLEFMCWLSPFDESDTMVSYKLLTL